MSKSNSAAIFNLFQFFIAKNYKDFKYCPLATVISVFGMVPMLVSLFLLYGSIFSDLQVYSQTVYMDWVISIVVFIAFFCVSIGINRLAGVYSDKYIFRLIRKDWEFADRYVIDNPELLDWCKEQNPEFEQKIEERMQSELEQDLEVERAAQEVRRGWRAERLAGGSKKENL